MSTIQLARKLGVSPARLNNWVIQGKLPLPTKVGRGFVWSPEDVARAERLLGACRVYRQEIESLRVEGKERESE